MPTAVAHRVHRWRSHEGKPWVYLHSAANHTRQRLVHELHLIRKSTQMMPFPNSFSTQVLLSTSQPAWNWRVSLKRRQTGISTFTRWFPLQPWVFRVSMIFTSRCIVLDSWIEPMLRLCRPQSGASWPRDSYCRSGHRQDRRGKFWGRAPATRYPQHLWWNTYLDALQRQETLREQLLKGNPKISK